MSKAQRRKLHYGINRLTADQVAAIVRQQFPRAKKREDRRAGEGRNRQRAPPGYHHGRRSADKSTTGQE